MQNSPKEEASTSSPDSGIKGNPVFCYGDTIPIPFNKINEVNPWIGFTPLGLSLRISFRL
jgi:hypothetical protein